MGLGIRNKKPVKSDSKNHCIIMGVTGRGKTHFGSTCPDSFSIGWDDRVYGVDGIAGINVRTLQNDILYPKVLDRKFILFLASNQDKVEDYQKVEFKDGLSKFCFSEIIRGIKEKKKLTIEEIITSASVKFPKNINMIKGIFERQVMANDEVDGIVERINYRNYFIKDLGDFEKEDKGLQLKIFRILTEEILSEGYKTLNLDDGKSFVTMCANFKLEEEGISEFGDLAMGKFYPIYREFSQEEMKNLLGKFNMVNVFCHEDYVEISDEHSDTKHMVFYPDFGDKKCLNEEMANWFTFVGRAILDPDDEEHPYKIDFTPKKYSLSKSPFKLGIKEPIINEYKYLEEILKK